MSEIFDQINPPARLLMGPGPINADPRVLRAMSAQLVGQYDPAMTHYMNETMALYRQVFETQNQWTILIDGTSRAGIEAVLVSAIEPGDKVLVPVFGRFGHLLTEIAHRCGAEVHTIEMPWGEVFKPEQIEEAIKKVQPKMLAVVQGDTSTTMLQPLEELGAICQRYGVLFYSDATASIAGNPFKTDAWGLDAVSVGLQKCLGGPSGSAPVTFSERYVEVVRKRQHVEAGIRDAHHQDSAGQIIRSNYFDIPMILDYWGEERLNHHTEASSMLYCARECARIVLQEGLDACITRHQLNGDAMRAGAEGLNLKLFGDQDHKMTNVLGVYIPEGIPGEAVRTAMLLDFGIEIGTSFGPLKGKIWRIGTMGYNARKDAVLVTLAALENVLRRMGHKLPMGEAVDRAMAVYGQGQ
ncbi:pyridoxal-phosphate-dependent aminotransferase family protein [Thiosulfativibrio zosterae]|uniref:Aminotransferase V n=1 Tax=Thiosulfativibrio zosterae TaxID=2675053 RepID=A0A6F8PP61_9GAMM|nr:alanine--glyoxylate aminotransferase family protein [Thiosulfativibrio zosterae]BBP43911.1 aminotransferase V [Thiosulfativibrio zosterae]